MNKNDPVFQQKRRTNLILISSIFIVMTALVGYRQGLTTACFYIAGFCMILLYDDLVNGPAKARIKSQAWGWADKLLHASKQPLVRRIVAVLAVLGLVAYYAMVVHR